MNLRAACCLLIFCVAPVAFAQQNVVILLDDSGSMNERLRSNGSLMRMDAAKSALTTVLQQMPDGTNVGLAVLNGGSNPWVIPFGPLDKPQINASVGSIRASGGTPLGELMKVAADQLLKARSEQYYGTYKLLVITDGEANDPQLVERFLPEILARGIVVDTIGVDMPGQHSLATQTNSYRQADNPESLARAISEVMAETSTGSGDAGASDFEMLEGLSPEIASAALAALAIPSNSPIGGEPEGSGAADGYSTYSAPNQTNMPPTNNDSGGGSSAAPFIFLLLIIFGLPLLIMSRVGKQLGRRK